MANWSEGFSDGTDCQPKSVTSGEILKLRSIALGWICSRAVQAKKITFRGGSGGCCGCRGGFRLLRQFPDVVSSLVRQTRARQLGRRRRRWNDLKGRHRNHDGHVPSGRWQRRRRKLKLLRLKWLEIVGRSHSCLMHPCLDFYVYSVQQHSVLKMFWWNKARHGSTNSIIETIKWGYWDGLRPSLLNRHAHSDFAFHLNSDLCQNWI